MKTPGPGRAGRRVFRPSWLQSLSLLVATASLAGLGLMADPAAAAKEPKPPKETTPAPEPAPAVDPATVPEGLKKVDVPEPSNLKDFIKDKKAAIRLGKALFWDMQLGSDGKTACASCHFHAGADNRSRNQLSPGLNRRSSPDTLNPDTTFQVGGPNYQIKEGDFPFHKLSDPGNRNSSVLRTHNDVASSMGVFNSRFLGAEPGAVADIINLIGDPVFQINGVQTRRLEPRSTPTFINSIFNFRNFWDGRATFLFNGVSPFGAMDTGAKVYKTADSKSKTASPVTVRIDKASLASLATGPALGDFEMSGSGRHWPNIGRRLLPAQPLSQQAVDDKDSVLGKIRNKSGRGLKDTYMAMVMDAFEPTWWQATNLIKIGNVPYTQAEANFSLFFGLAIQMYGATQVSDDSRFDRHMDNDSKALSTEERLGLALFFGKGKCANCHGGAELTTASTRNILKGGPLSRMTMGNGATAVYDGGFYNISIRQTLDDISNGARNDVNRPMATAKLAQEVGADQFKQLIGISPNLTVSKDERLAINGAIKTPGLRNVELTAPYFSNGDSLTLEQVVAFYNRGGNHFRNNLADVDADIQPLHLSESDQKNLVAFLKSLTDERVRLQKAPFDHPELFVPNGHETDASGRAIVVNGAAKDIIKRIAAVGKDGLDAAMPNFLEAMDAFALVAGHSGMCVNVKDGSTTDEGKLVQLGCHGAKNQLWEQVAASQGFMLRNKNSGLCMEVKDGNLKEGTKLHQVACKGGASQLFNWLGSRLKVNHSQLCVNVKGAKMKDDEDIIQSACSADANFQFAKR